ncbi:DUF1801 domain-containing protein [Rhodobacter sp. Har01]|uniref:DUF1801 domain-containing protein n=1 Tax=Rhodobacter sp. Har01 TaxID=2883999 RepID=UPI001D08334C|nr:DUF1801 domain-containing protein [Rhodobacter sp. Har01]MCB6178219.1 DUF1801 domain-containing protein [Rhodobacter sp. Har01]
MAHVAKTTSAPLDVAIWLAGVDPARQAEAEALLALFRRVTGWEARLWGPSIVGFGRYVYRYDSGHGGEAAATGFSPRKAEIVLYIPPGYRDYGAILSRLGPHRVGKACLYLKRLAGLDLAALEELVRVGLADLAARWPVHPV